MDYVAIEQIKHEGMVPVDLEAQAQDDPIPDVK